MSVESPSTRQAQRGTQPYGTALLILGSAGIHFAVVPEHLHDYVPFGLFFIGAGVSQLVLAVAIVAAPSRRLFLVGAAGTLGLIALWAVSRTAGLPIGPHPGRPEAIGFSDITCLALEVACTVLLVRLAFRRPHSRRRGPVRAALTAAPAVLLATILTGVGVGSAINGMPYQFAGPMVAGQPSTNLGLLTEAPGSEPVKSFTLTAQTTRIAG